MTINTMATKRILIVDDQAHVLDVLRDIIARFQHGHAYEITTAHSVADALDILQRERFDLILLDMVMPGIGRSGGRSGARDGSSMRTRPESRQSCRVVPRQQRPSIIHSRTFTHDVVCGGRSNQLIGHGDHKPPRNARLERLPEGTPSACSAEAESGRHRLRRSPAPTELVIVDAVAKHDEQANE